jgi:N-acyl-L-homoserine lactone synthetase
MKKISENFARLSILKDEVLKKTELIEVSRFIVEDARKAASMASELAKVHTASRNPPSPPLSFPSSLPALRR